MKTSRVLIIVLLFILSGIYTPAQKRTARSADLPATMVSDRLPEGEAPRVIQPESTGDPDSLISNATYPMTVLGGWPLENMSGGTTQLIGPSTDNDNSVLAPIGFIFRYDNANFTTFGVNGNGFLTFGLAPSGASAVNSIMASPTNTPRIMPFWDDLCVGSNGKVHYKTINTGVTRKLIVEWQNMQITRNGACSGPGAGTFQLWLLENIGVIQFVYGNGMAATAAADNGYSIGLHSLSPGNFASITTASDTVSYAAANDSQTSAIPTGKSYVFAPPVPPPPSSGSVTAVTQTSLQLNWVDNASTETVYQVKRSTDNVNFTVIANPQANSTGYADSGLIPGTQYFYRICALSEGAFGEEISLSATTNPNSNISSTGAGGLWSSPGTWAGGVVPAAADYVTIVDGSTVTIDTTAAALTLTVGSSGALSESDAEQLGVTTATLTFGETAAHSLTIGGNVLIKSSGIFATPGLGNVTGHVLSVAGNLTNNGALDFSTNNNQAGAGITFTGASNNTFGGTGAVTDIRTITVNKGDTLVNLIELNPSNFTVQGSTTDTPGSGFLTVTNGTFKISGTSSGTHRTFSAAAYTIGPTGGIWLSNPNYTVTAQAGTATVSGVFRVTSGTYNVGTAAGESLVFVGGFAGLAVIEGGAVNVAGRFGLAEPSTFWTYNQSGGTITTCTSFGNSSESACFDLGFGFLSQVSITGGNIVIQNRNMGLVGPRDYRHQAGTTGAGTVTGGTVRFGNASTIAPASFGGAGIFPNVVIDNTAGGATSFIMGTPQTFLNITRNVTIDPGTTFNIGGNGTPYLMNGSSFVNNGTLSSLPNSNFVWFDPAGNPTYSGTGVSTGILPNLTVQGQSLTLAGSNNIRIRNLVVFTGNIINANKLTLGNNDDSLNSVQFGSQTTPTLAGTLDTAPVFNLGNGGQMIKYLRTGNIRTTGPEVNPSRALVSLIYDNDDPATDELNIAGGDLTVTGTLHLTNGEIKTGANKLTHNGPVTRVNGYVNGTLIRYMSVSGSYTFHVGVNGYSPAIVFIGLIFSMPSMVSVKPVDAILPGLDPSVSASRYWEVAQSGSITGRLSFIYTDADINGDETAYGAWVSRGGGNPLRESQTNNPAQNSVTSSQDLTNFAGNWGPGCCVVPRSVGGTIRTAGGAPIRNATVILSGGGLPAPRVAQTGSFGSYLFDNVLTGTQYNIFVSAKRFRFTPISRDIILAGDDFTQDFTANPQEGGLLFEPKKP